MQWLINGVRVLPENQTQFHFFEDDYGNGTITIHIGITKYVTNNNTQLRCLATDGNSTDVISDPAYLIIIGI